MALHDKFWRLSNLYRIINKDPASVPFRPNPIQIEVLTNLHQRNLILKARQIGLSTGAILYILDEILFTENLQGGIVSYSLEHAKHIFKKIIGHAIETLPPEIKRHVGIVQSSAREITFNNGSSLRVDTTLRGASYPLVLVSEFGKTCARNPKKAEEVITGTLQAVPKDGRIIIESTGEGNEGFFAEMVTQAHLRGNHDLNPLEYKLFFFPWMDDATYTLPEKVVYDVSLTDYFNKIEKETGRIITQGQRNWYGLQSKILGDKIKQEYPSTISEAFLVSNDAYYFSEAINRAYTQNRCLTTQLHDPLLPVYCAMDIGVNDLTVIIFFQIAHGEVRVFDYYEDKNKDVPFYVNFLLRDKPYRYSTIFLPHDSRKRSPLDVNNTYERDFQRLLEGTNTRIHVLPAKDVQLSISHTKMMIDRTVFNISRVKHLVDQLSKYRKTWSEIQGRYLEKPQETVAEHYADAFRYVCQAVQHLETVSSYNGALEKHRKVTESRYRRVI